MAEDASAMKFLVSSFMNYKMVDTRPDDEVAWWVDSGATSHVCKDLHWFQVCKSIEDGSFMKMGNVATEPIKGIGRVLLTFTSGKTLCLDNVLYVLGIRKNLVSEIVLNKCGYKQVLESDKYILSRHGSFVGFGYVCNGMIRLNLNYPLFNASACMITSSHSNSLSKSELWHARLGLFITITRQPFKGVNQESKVLDLIHSDLCDFHANPSLGHNKYVITFIDDASRYCYVYLLHAKHEALDKFKIYKQEVELQRQDLIKVLRTDRGGEYYDPVYFQSTGIIHQTTAPYTPQQNGVAERKNRTLKEMVKGRTGSITIFGFSLLAKERWHFFLPNESWPVMEQYHEMLRILGQYTQHNLMMDEAISVAVIIDKLPPSWKEFKHSLKHKRSELNFVQSFVIYELRKD
ncbi:zinc finger, CCHC-type containing protein [Tanacetum coccineum]